MSTVDWLALAVGVVLLGHAAAHTAKQWLRKAIAARTCPLCGCGCRANTPPERTFSDGAAQLIDHLDRRKEQR